MNEDKVKDYYSLLEKNGGCGPVMFAVLLLLVLLLASCRTVQYVEVPVSHTEYVYRDRVDSVQIRDSVYIRETQKGDTVKVLEYRWRDRFQYVGRVDTVSVRDTVTVVAERVVVQTEYKTRGVVKVLAFAGFLALCGFILYIVFRFII